MKRKKISYVPFNLLSNISSFLMPLLWLPILTPTLDSKLVYIISIYIYMSRVFQASEIDFLEDRIKSLEEKA